MSSDSRNQKVGFIGLGAMGAPMARNVYEAGYDLSVYNRTRSKAEEFAEGSIGVASSPREIAEESNVVIIIVTDDEALMDVLEGGDEGYHDEDGSLVSGLDASNTVINMSTVSPNATQKADRLVRGTGANFVDSPVSGTVGPAKEGTLTVLAGGDEELVEDFRPLLETMGEPVVYCGDVVQGTRMKLFINLLLGGMMQTFSESLVFGKKNGLDLDKMSDVVESGPLDAPLFRIKGENIRERDFEPRFTVDLLFKDLSLMLETSGDEEIPLPVTSATREAVNATRALGYGDEDMSAIIKYLEEVGGVRVGSNKSGE